MGNPGTRSGATPGGIPGPRATRAAGEGTGRVSSSAPSRRFLWTKTYQNSRHSPSWMMRAGAAEVIVPRAGEFVEFTGTPRFVWLRALKNSERNCTRRVSTAPHENDFERAASTFAIPGARKILR